MSKSVRVTLTPSAADPVEITSCAISEAYSTGIQKHGVGWQAVVRVEAIMTNPMGSDEIIDMAKANEVTPGKIATVKMYSGGTSVTRGEDAGSLVRTWPGVIQEVRVIESYHVTEAVYEAVVVDPITYLEERVIWGAYAHVSLGELVGAALSLAAGGSGKPTLEPALPELPPITIETDYRTALNDIRIAIACGQTLREWLNDITGRLGVRFEFTVDAEGGVIIHLVDRLARVDAPAFNIDVIGYGGIGGSARVSEERYQITEMSTSVVAPGLRTLIDSPGQAFPFVLEGRATDGWIGTVLDFPGAAEVEEAETLASLSSERSSVYGVRLVMKSAQPGVTPGTRLTMNNASFSGIRAWQCATVRHTVVKNAYENRILMVDGAQTWRPSLPERRASIVVSGIIDQGAGTKAGELLSHDHLGQLPVSLVFHPARSPFSDDAENDAENSAENSAENGADWATPLRLPALSPMAGYRHGFLIQGRQLDCCQVMVHHPLFAEIVGFEHRANAPISDKFINASLGFIAEAHENGDDWSGILIQDKEHSKDLKGEMTAKFVSGVSKIVSTVSALPLKTTKFDSMALVAKGGDLGVKPVNNSGDTDTSKMPSKEERDLLPQEEREAWDLFLNDEGQPLINDPVVTPIHTSYIHVDRVWGSAPQHYKRRIVHKVDRLGSRPDEAKKKNSPYGKHNFGQGEASD